MEDSVCGAFGCRGIMILHSDNIYRCSICHHCLRIVSDTITYHFDSELIDNG